jgi:hypothetical protein
MGNKICKFSPTLYKETISRGMNLDVYTENIWQCQKDTKNVRMLNVITILCLKSKLMISIAMGKAGVLLL